MAKHNGKSIYPNPVIVGFFGNGEQVRMSFQQPKGKPWRFAAMRQMICEIVGNERGRAAAVDWHKSYWRAGGNYKLPTGPAATDLLCYFIEWQGDCIRDEPDLTPAQKKAARKAQRVRERDPARKRVVPFTPKVKPAAKRHAAPSKRRTATGKKRAA